MEIRRSPELEAIVRRMWNSFSRADGLSLLNTTADDPSTRLILSGNDEWFQGAEALPMVRERGSLVRIRSLEFDRLEAYEAGEVGWTACVIVTTSANGDVRTFRQTGVFVLRHAVWKMVQWHTSVGVPPADVFGVELAGGLAALVDALGQSQSNELLEAAGDRGVVTVMFTDIEGSTRLSRARGDSRWSRDITRHFDQVAAAVESHGGRVVKTLGDGSMAAFPTASGAAAAALEIQQLDDDDEVLVRIGVHSGEAVALGDDYSGVTVAKAARVTAAAGGGETLVSSATRELLDDLAYDIGEPRTVELKGLAGAHQVYPLAAP